MLLAPAGVAPGGVAENRTEALDASRKVVRDGKMIFPRTGKVMQELAKHMACDVKQLIEDQDTGAKSFRYVRTGTDHYSLAFTYDCIAWSNEPPPYNYVSTFHYDEEEHKRNCFLHMQF